MFQQLLLTGTSMSIIPVAFFYLWGWVEELSCYVTPETKLRTAKELCTVICIAYWFLGYISLHFFSTWSFLPSVCSGTGATCCLEANSYMSFGPFHPFPPMYQGSQARNTLGYLIDTSFLLLFFFWHKIGLSFIVERMPLTDVPNEAKGENRLRKIFLEIYQIHED